MKKKTLKILLGVIIGLCLIGACWGCLYGLNASVRGWFDNAFNTATKNVPEEYKNRSLGDGAAIAYDKDSIEYVSFGGL